VRYGLSGCGESSVVYRTLPPDQRWHPSAVDRPRRKPIAHPQGLPPDVVTHEHGGVAGVRHVSLSRHRWNVLCAEHPDCRRCRAEAKADAPHRLHRSHKLQRRTEHFGATSQLLTADRMGCWPERRDVRSDCSGDVDLKIATATLFSKGGMAPGIALACLLSSVGCLKSQQFEHIF